MTAATVVGTLGLRERLGGHRGALLLALWGGLVFCAIFYWRYAGIDPEAYQFRDDGVITLSHARNWVDHGFIGVNPSGERIEASSAPLQLLLYAAAYAVGGMDFKSFMSAQTLVCTFALGVLFALLFAQRPRFALAACVAGAFLLTELSAFLVWHGSGMENALLHVFLLWTVVLLLRFARQGRVGLAWAAVPFLASICRVEAIFHVAPVLLVFCVYWHFAYRDAQARRFASAFAALWILFNLARYAYFGTLMPNTAVAQGISVGDRILELVTLSPTYLDQSFNLARGLFTRHGGYLLLLALPAVLFRAAPPGTALPLALVGSLLATSLAAPFFFGPARLDVGRTTTQLALFVVVAVGITACHWRLRRADAFVVPAAALLAFLVHDFAGVPPMAVCCSTRDFDATRQAFARIGTEQGLHRPTVANPDLGVLSWHKQFNVVDLGLLGSTLVPRLGPGRALDDYLLDYAAPDIIESHGWWTCRYASMLTDPRFSARYVYTGAPGGDVHACKGVARVPTGIWVRRDVLRDSGSDERALIDALGRQPSVERLARELQRCQQASDPAVPAACSYVARAAYRLLPELRAQGDQQRLEAVFSASRTRDLDLFLLTGARDPRAWRAALAWLQPAP